MSTQDANKEDIGKLTAAFINVLNRTYDTAHAAREAARSAGADLKTRWGTPTNQAIWDAWETGYHMCMSEGQEEEGRAYYRRHAADPRAQIALAVLDADTIATIRDEACTIAGLTPARAAEVAKAYDMLELAKVMTPVV